MDVEVVLLILCVPFASLGLWFYLATEKWRAELKGVDCMEEEDLKVGDVVRLKSGGYPMTVIQAGLRYRGTQTPVVRCMWHTNGIHRQDTYPVAALRKFEHE